MVNRLRLVYNFRLVGSAHHSELRSSDTKGNHWIVKDAIGRKLSGRSPRMIILNNGIQDDGVLVEFLPVENYYIFRITIECLDKVGNDEDSLKACIEALISEALVELFGDGISVF